jgi:integrase
MDEQKLTKSVVDKIPLTTEGQKFYWDSDLAGFGLRVGTKTKSYFAEGRVQGKTVRFTIGKHGVFTAEQARSEAKDALQKMAKGINPNDTKRHEKAKGVTLGDAFKDFLLSRKNLKTRTKYDYNRLMGLLPESTKKNPRKKAGYLADWNDKALTSITKDMVERRHAKLGEASPAQANLAMRFLRAVFNFAAGKYEDSKGRPIILENPVKRLSQTEAWYRVERRKTVIKAHDLKAWYEAVIKLGATDKGETVRDYLLLLLFTGLRRQEGAQLPFSGADFKARTITVLDTKNREDHVLPMSDLVLALLTARREAIKGDFVFPGEGKGGYLVEPRKQMDKVAKTSKVDFTLHDLRRTFATIAESLDIPAYAIKRLLNHKMPGDVTAGYIVTDVERLREPMQKITDFIARTVGIKDSTPVEMPREKRKR